MKAKINNQRITSIDLLIEMHQVSIKAAEDRIKELKIEKRELEGVVENK